MSEDDQAAVPPLPWRERCRIAAWAVGLTAAVGAVSGLSVSILAIQRQTAVFERVEAVGETAAIGVVTGSLTGVLLSPFGLIVAAIAIFSVRRGGSAEAQRRGIAAVVALLVGVSMTALLINEFPSRPTLLQVVLHAGVGLSAIFGSAGLVWAVIPRILARYESSPEGD